MTQQKQQQWLNQWQSYQDNELFLFKDWIFPNTLESFRNTNVLECGCGGGQHTEFMSPFANRVVAVDLNSLEVARDRNKTRQNVEFIDADISEMKLPELFDIVLSIGVVHHTDSPDLTVENMIRHIKPGGRLILWVYSKEGNWIAENVVERLRSIFLRNTSTRLLNLLSFILTAILHIPVYTIYMLPAGFLPYFEYFHNFRRLSFRRNMLNVFDKLNAPQVQFIDFDRVNKWFDDSRFEQVHIQRYRGVSWQCSGTIKMKDLN